MTPRRFGLVQSLLAAGLAVGAVGAAPTPLAVNAVTATLTAQPGEMTPPAVRTQQVQTAQALLRFSQRYYRPNAIWNGSARRGNWRGRSRWNYNR